MPSLWDLYLDADDAATLLDALVVLEQARAVREPPPIEDLEELLRRLQTVARLSDDDAVLWQREAADREDDAAVDGGRWGHPEVARQLRDSADALARGHRQVAEVASAAARDLADRLAGAPIDEVRRAAEATALAAQELLRRHAEDPDQPAE